MIIDGPIEKRRPCVRLFFPKTGRGYQLVVDTGCTYQMIIYKEFQDELGLEVLGGQYAGGLKSGFVASGEPIVFAVKQVEVVWFGEHITVPVRVPPRDRIDPRTNEIYCDGTIGLIGAAMLENITAVFDFPGRKVTLHRADTHFTN